MKRKTKFGAFRYPTPMWAKWGFRIFSALTTVAAFIVANDPGIDVMLKIRIGVYLKGADMFVLLFINSLGNVPKNQ